MLLIFFSLLHWSRQDRRVLCLAAIEYVICDPVRKCSQLTADGDIRHSRFRSRIKNHESMTKQFGSTASKKFHVSNFDVIIYREAVNLNRKPPPLWTVWLKTKTSNFSKVVRLLRGCGQLIRKTTWLTKVPMLELYNWYVCLLCFDENDNLDSAKLGILELAAWRSQSLTRRYNESHKVLEWQKIWNETFFNLVDCG